MVERDADAQAHAYGLRALGLSRPDLSDARADWEECVRVAETIGDVHTLCIATGNLSACAIAAGEHARAEELNARALALARRFRLQDLELYALGMGAQIAYARDDIGTTDDLTRQALPLAVQLGFKEMLMYLFELRAAVCARLDDTEPAGCLLGASQRLCEELGAHRDPHEAALRDVVLERLELELGPEALASLQDRGRMMPLSEAVVLAGAALRPGG